MITFRSFLLSSMALCSLQSNAHDFFSPEQTASLEERAQQWANACIVSMEPEAVQITANVLYLLYVNAIVDSDTRQCATACYQTARAARANFITKNEAFEEFAMLHQLAQECTQLLTMRTVLTKTLLACQTHCSQSHLSTISDVLILVQQHGQDILCAWADEYSDNTSEHLTGISNVLEQSSKELSNASHYFNNLGKFILPSPVEDKFKNLALLDIGLNATLESTLYADQIVDVFDNTIDYIQTIISVSSEIYKHYYTALYTATASKSPAKNNSIMFGINGIIPTEYQVYQLPHPDKAFEFTFNLINNSHNTIK